LLFVADDFVTIALQMPGQLGGSGLAQRATPSHHGVRHDRGALAVGGAATSDQADLAVARIPVALQEAPAR